MAGGVFIIAGHGVHPSKKLSTSLGMWSGHRRLNEVHQADSDETSQHPERKQHILTKELKLLLSFERPEEQLGRW